MTQQLQPASHAISDAESRSSALLDGRAEQALAEMSALPDGPRRERLRAELVEMHAGYARSVARRYRGRGEPLEDIEQAALLGLVKAINRFDPEVGERFLAYAAQVVTGEVKRHFRDRTWTIRVPRRLQELRISMRGIAHDFTHEHGRAPTVPELAGLMEIGEEEVIEVLGTTDAYRPVSLDTPLLEGEDGSALGDMIGAEDASLQSIVDRAALLPLLDTLPDRDRTIVLQRFWGNRTQSEIADRLGISQMHVSRLLSRSISHLRTELISDR